MQEAVQELVIFGVSFHKGVVISSLVITIALTLLSLFAARDLKEKPAGRQSAVEAFYETMAGMVERSVPEGARGCAPMAITLFVFVLLSNLIGVVPGLEAPTADVNVPVSLAVVVFGMTVYYGSKAKGVVGYLRSFIKPNPLFLPINLIATITKPLTMAFRLFGNLFVGELLIVVLAKAIPVGVPAAFSLFNVFVGVIQAYLFFMLALAYVAVAYEE